MILSNIPCLPLTTLSKAHSPPPLPAEASPEGVSDQPELEAPQAQMLHLLHAVEASPHEPPVEPRHVRSVANHHEGLLKQGVEAGEAERVRLGRQERPVQEHVVLWVSGWVWACVLGGGGRVGAEVSAEQEAADGARRRREVVPGAVGERGGERERENARLAVAAILL